MNPRRTIRGTLPDEEDTDEPSEPPPPIRHAQVLDRLATATDSIHKMSTSIRDGLAPSRDLPDVLRESAHKAACAAVKVVETRLDGHDARFMDTESKINAHAVMIAAQSVAVTEIKTTLRNVAAFIGFCFLAGGLLVSVTFYIVSTRH